MNLSNFQYGEGRKSPLHFSDMAARRLRFGLQTGCIKVEGKETDASHGAAVW